MAPASLAALVCAGRWHALASDPCSGARDHCSGGGRECSRDRSSDRRCVRGHAARDRGCGTALAHFVRPGPGGQQLMTDAERADDLAGGQSARKAVFGDVVAWVEQAQAGDREAFGALYDAYADTVYRYIYYRVGGKATAEDLTSETFLRALARIASFTWRGRDLGAWLVTIARNLVADHFKSTRFRLEVTTGEFLDSNEAEPSPEDHVLASATQMEVTQALLRLPPRMRQVIWMQVTGTPTSAIANRLDIAPATVRAHLHQARQRLLADPFLASLLPATPDR
ncbi:sigma-70 family RNA polymerase sigma factor [Streptomyces sp. NPDC058678]|uniref:sigma-70 family RNA polymerase sigma factor n=1 Tax=Streptomyces sp. NPDC058678 TaxID=3346595 RepID=UPI0036498777